METRSDDACRLLRDVTAPDPSPQTPHPNLIVTLDGPAGSGKSSVARKLAARLGVDFLDTGAMYRGITAAALDAGLDPESDPAAVAELARTHPLTFDWQTDPPRLLMDGRDVTDRLRDDDVAAAVSEVAAIADVRAVLVDAQRRIGDEHPRLVTEGRDQGSVVFPQAEAKYYLDAAPEVRARRRADQLREAGRSVDEAKILEQIRSRDHRDSTRPDAPLTCPDDAERIDTSGLSLDEVLDLLEKLVRERMEPQMNADERR